MSTITLPNIRVGSDLQVRVRLKDGGVAIDWSTLSNIKACIYSDAQRALAGRCAFSIDEEDNTLLVCTYAANKPQYLGVNRIVISAKYMGETKTYDKPAFSFVRWTADQEGEEITIDDPDVDVEITVEDVSSSILQEAVDAAFSAADRANEAAAAAEHMVDIHTGPEGKSAYEVAVDEGYTGTEEEWLASLKGDTGETPDISIGTVTTVEPGTPAAASMTGTPEAPVLNLSIPKGLVGATPNFTVGTVTTGEPGSSVIVTITGTPEAPVLNLTIPQGMQGNTGSSVDYPYELVNNLTTNDATKGLSAAQGVVLAGQVSQLEHKLYGFKNEITGWESGKYIITNQGVGNVCSKSRGNASNYECIVYPVTSGLNYIVNGVGGSAAALWCFLDENDIILSVAADDTSASGDSLVLVPPQGATQLILNNKGTGTSYEFYPNPIKERLEDTEDGLADLKDVTGDYVENPEFVRVVTDANGRILYGVRKDGDFVFGAGIPSTIEEELIKLDAEKVDKEAGKSLINSDYAAAQESDDNPEWMQVYTDNDGKVLFGIKKTGEIEWSKGVPKPVKEYLETISGWYEKSDIFTHCYDGEPIRINPRYRYKKIAQSTHASAMQGCAAFGDYLFQFHGQNNKEGGLPTLFYGIEVFNLRTEEKVQEILLGFDELKHNNAATFGKTFYAENDPFPLLYVSQEDANARYCTVYRITGTEGSFVVTMVQVICLPSRDVADYGTPNCFVDENIIVYTGFVAPNTEAFEVFPLPSISDGYTVNVGTITIVDGYGETTTAQGYTLLDGRVVKRNDNDSGTTIKSVFLDESSVTNRFTLPLLNKYSGEPATTQGGVIANGILYQVYGNAGNAILKAIDIEEGSVKSTINLSAIPVMNYEPESAFVFDSCLGVSFNQSGNIFVFDFM